MRTPEDPGRATAVGIEPNVVGHNMLSDGIEDVRCDLAGPGGKHGHGPSGRQTAQVGHPQLNREAAPWREVTAAFSNTAIWRCCVSTLLMPLNTWYTRLKTPSTRAVVMSPCTTGMRVSSTLEQLVDHWLGQLDASHRDTRFGQRNCDATRPDRHLKR